LAEALQKGQTVAEIKGKLGLTQDQVARGRFRLRGWGMSVPYSRPRFVENPKLAQAFREVKTDEEIKDLLKRVRLAFYHRNVKGDESLLLSVSRVAAGFHFRTQDLPLFVLSLERAGIPVGKLTNVVKNGPQAGVNHYFFIARQHLECAQQAFSQDPNLASFLKNPVTQVFGPAMGHLPTTTELTHKRSFSCVSSLFAPFGIYRFHGKGMHFRDIFTADCPAPILKDRTAYYYPVDQQGQLSTFIQKRLQAMGRI